MKKIFYLLFFFTSLNLFSQDRITGELFSTRSEVIAKNGMVATSHPLASQVGIDILKKGGNAIDAAIAMAFVLPICEPQSTGLFGDVFALNIPEDGILFPGGMKVSAIPNVTAATLLIDK